VAVTLNWAVCPAVTVTGCGCPVMTGAMGAGLTVSSAALLRTSPAVLRTPAV